MSDHSQIGKQVENFSKLIEDTKGKKQRQVAQGYVSMVPFDPKTRKPIPGKTQVTCNTVVDDARRSAAAAFSGIPGSIGLGFKVEQYRLGYSDVLNNHWDLDKPQEVPFDDNALLPEYTPGGFSPSGFGYFHTQAHTNGVDGKSFVGFGSSLAAAPIALGVDYPFNGDEFAVRLFVELDETQSSLATFDTVEVITENGARFAARWTYPIEKQANWGLFIEHLILF